MLDDVFACIQKICFFKFNYLFYLSHKISVYIEFLNNKFNILIYILYFNLIKYLLEYIF